MDRRGRKATIVPGSAALGAAMVFMGIAPGFVMRAAQEAVKALAV